ncbi:DUF882 domain-containing protein [Nitrogeniibacter mangrovi]|uniref:Murein endopeptidase K n=1 Tax=Nitrogeniibacter mangrovi TaxID=2016596 RepID=A0A6C1B3P9_9RHOO|nr:DUF882 domain-containing protein [Nitrogeniibacter mangrovi]QID16824.1 DUF882 domain-containing protein [Nitrogeniibacter mangrovi]
MPKLPHARPCPTRRRLIQTLGGLSLGLGLGNAWGRTEPCRLSFHHLHTGERLSTVYRVDGRYQREALTRIAWLLRDFRTGKTHPMDPQLLDILHALSLRCEGETFEVISGYRAPATNAMLARTTSGVARHSLHMEGRAIDVRLTGRATAQLRDAALALRRGGVGFYPDSDFVHLDTGRVRAWGPRGA